MDIELLKTFLEVRTTRHFGKASENLYLTQAAVSARIRQLEDHLGVKLFIRNRNNIQLTSEGERLIPHAETMLVAWSRAQQEVALKLEQKHQINLGTTLGLWHYAVQSKLPMIQQANPDVALRAEAHTVDELLRLLIERTLDLVLLYDPPQLPELTSHSIGKMQLKLVSSIKDITVKEALHSHYVYIDWGTAFGMFHAKRFGEAPPAVLHTNMASIAEAFIKNGQGSAYLPHTLTDDSIHDVEGAPAYSREIYAVYRSSSERINTLQALIPVLEIE